MRIGISTWILLLILLASFLVRIQRLDYPLSSTFRWGDGTRDFLVANHIVKYGELPLLGPFNLLNETGIRNSPVYFYILSLLLLPLNNILTLSLVNILLQMAVLVLIYLIAERIFGKITAIFSLMLFGFNPEVIKQADFIWQPYLMQAVGLLSLYLLLKGYTLLSFALLSIAFALHNSAIAWIPLFFAISRARLRFLLIVVITLTLLYLPVLFFYYQNGLPSYLTTSPIYIYSIKQFLSNLFFNISQFSKVFYLDNFSFLILSTVPLVLTLIKKENRQTKIFTMMIFLLFLTPIIFASFFNKIRLHYLILSFAMFAILVSRLLSYFSFRTAIALFLASFIVFSGNFSFVLDFKKPLENQKMMDKITSTILGGLPESNSFQVVSFAQSEATFEYPVLDTILLVPLEGKLQRKLASVSDYSPYNHFQINEKKYLIVACFRFYKSFADVNCSDQFQKSYPDYTLIKTLGKNDTMTIYLAEFNH